RMGHRLDVARLDGVELLNEAENPRQAVDIGGQLVLRDRKSRKMRDALHVLTGQTHEWGPATGGARFAHALADESRGAETGAKSRKKPRAIIHLQLVLCATHC